MKQTFPEIERDCDVEELQYVIDFKAYAPNV